MCFASYSPRDSLFFSLSFLYLDVSFSISEIEKMSRTQTTRKRKRNFIDTYRDLKEGEASEYEVEDSDSVADNWAAANLYIV